MTTVTSVFNEREVRPFFEMVKASIHRSRQPFTILLLKIHEKLDARTYEAIRDFLANEIRLTDVLFQVDQQNTWGLLLTQSGANEASALLNRLESRKPNISEPFTACMIEIRNESAEFNEIVEKGLEAVQLPGVHRVRDFEERKIEQIKVSILEENSMFRKVLATTIKSIHLDGMKLDLQVFEDGQAFLESDWIKSAHMHIVILNDILPRRNGLDILHTLRQMPNQQKFIVFMMTSNQSEEEMIRSYEKGVDGFFIKPINIRLFEAQIKRTCKGLWR
ncbi:response regulator [Lysinibacillus halotolerans]|uniref:Response regulator n=1 Tax=Lysinibacillus halotolerans TaxID=1368476 RepID=A0A3M8H439_9BACI|nr:response regulator [Lysinibacillus halotolerans]RNC97235.1 response regulator [Lysinibacillus halotolerans]